MKFNTGDKVRCISMDGHMNLTIDKIYTVTRKGVHYVQICNDKQNKISYRSTRFTLIPHDIFPEELFQL